MDFWLGHVLIFFIVDGFIRTLVFFVMVYNFCIGFMNGKLDFSWYNLYAYVIAL